MLAAVAAAQPARAACPSIAARAAATTDDARARAAWIDARLSATGHTARIWAWAWGGGIGASGVASLAVVPFVAHADRVDWYTSAGSAAIGVLPFLLAPPAVIRDSRELHARIAAPPATDDAACALLADAETRLVRDAEDQRDQQRWYLHAGNLAFNTGVLLFLGLGFHHWEGGLINGIAGAAVGETLILTQPTGTIRDLAEYRAGF